MDKITVITAISGGKDKPLPQPEYPNVRYLSFVNTCNKFTDPVLNAKIYKILAHKYCNTPYIVWVDGNIVLKKDPHELIKIMGDKDMAFFKHPWRDCLYEEATQCVARNKGDVLDITEQINAYRKQKVKEHLGLCETGAHIRKNNPSVNELFDKWWVEITRYSSRDQISFPYVFKEWATIPGSIQYSKRHENFPGNEYFEYRRHNF